MPPTTPGTEDQDVATATAGDTTVRYDPASARLSVVRNSIVLVDGRLDLDVGPGLPTSGAATVESIVPRETTDTTDTTDAGASGGVRVVHDDAWETTLDLVPHGGVVDVSVRATNRTDAPATVRELRVLAEAPTGFSADAHIYWHGYQSWTPTATLPVGERFPAESDRTAPQMLDHTAPRDTSHGVIGLIPRDGPKSALTLGFLEHDRYVSRFDVNHDDRCVRSLEAVCPGDGVPVAPGDTVSTATLRVDATHPLPDALRRLGDAIGRRMDARVPAETPTGWCSWYHYFTDVTADDVRENRDALDDWGAPLDVVQLDDGYETAFGDWTSLADGFDDPDEGAHPAILADDIDSADHTPGLWLAPFYVQGDSGLADAHPDWLVTRDGDPVDAGPRHGPMYGLDTTHPGALDWLRDTFETVVHDWGFAYLKLDFLYAAALPGDRHDDAVTRAEAYRRGLRVIRETVGDDVTILGCGAPQFPSVGLVDAMRVGPDTAPHWRDTPASQPAHENAIRNVTNRQWTHRRLWHADPDCQLVRDTTDLTTPERRSFAALVALLGGSNVVSDRIADIGNAGRRLVERTLPPAPGGRVEGLGNRELPARVVCRRDVDGALAIATFNWRDDPASVQLDPADYGLPDAPVWDALAERIAGHGAVERTIPPHGCLVHHVAPAPADGEKSGVDDRDGAKTPRLLAADHLANLAGLVTDIDGSDDGLTVTLDAPAPERAVIYDPSRDGEPIRHVTLHPGRTTITRHARPNDR